MTRPRAGLPRQLHRALRAPDARGREGVRVACSACSGCPWTGRRPTRRSGRSRAAPRSGASCGWPPRASPTRPRRPRCGTSTSAPRSPRPRSRTASKTAIPPHRVRPRRRRQVEIETSRPELIPACVALVAHPVRRALRRAGRPDRADAVVPGAGAGGRPRAGRPREGLGHRDDLHVRRCHRRDVVEGAGPAGAGRDPPRRHADRGSFRGAGLGVARRRGRRTQAMAALTGKASKQARRQIVELLRERGALLAEPEPIRHVVKFYEKGDRPLEVITSPAMVRPDDGAEGRAVGSGARDRLAPIVHGCALRHRGSRA